MHSYNRVEIQKDMDFLLGSIAGFHDSMTKEIHIINRGYVTKDRGMVCSHRFDAQLLIQSQWEPFGLELLFLGIEELHVTGPQEYWSASGQVGRRAGPVDKVEIRMSFGGHLKISSEALLWRERRNWLGKGSFLRDEVPSVDTVPAERILDDWRQCSSCKDAWQCPPREEFSLCPNCGAVTQLSIEVDR